MCRGSWSEIHFGDLRMGQVPIADCFPMKLHCWNSFQLWASSGLPPLLQSIALQEVLMVASCIRSLSTPGQGTCAHCHQWEKSSRPYLPFFVLSLWQAVQSTAFCLLLFQKGIRHHFLGPQKFREYRSSPEVLQAPYLATVRGMHSISTTLPVTVCLPYSSISTLLKF